MSKIPTVRVGSSSDQRFVKSSHRRAARQQRLRLLKSLLFLVVLGVFYYLAGHNLMLRLWARTRQGGEEWKTGTERTVRHIQERESVGGQQRR